jgi:hypothetical protein
MIVGGILVMAKLGSRGRTSAISQVLAERLAPAESFRCSNTRQVTSPGMLLNIAVGRISVPTWLEVVPDLETECELGGDFLESAGAIMDYSSKTTWLGGQAIPWLPIAATYWTTAGTPSGLARVAC